MIHFRDVYFLVVFRAYVSWMEKQKKAKLFWDYFQMKASEVRILTEDSMECHPRGFQPLLFTADFFWMERVTETHLLRRKNPSVLYLPKLPMVARFVRDLSLFPEILKNPWLYVRDLLHVPSSSLLWFEPKKSIWTSETICNVMIRKLKCNERECLACWLKQLRSHRFWRTTFVHQFLKALPLMEYFCARNTFLIQ